MENISYVYCGEGHIFDNCPSNPAAVCYMGNQNRNSPYSNSYNPSWRQHSNFSWSNQGTGPGNSSMPPRPNFPPGYPPQAPQQRPQQQAMQSSSPENMLKEYIVKNEAMIQSQAASLRNLETQVGQLANELRNRPHGTLPSDTKNPRNGSKEHCKAVTLRSGKGLENSKANSGHEGEPSSIQINEEIQKDTEIPSVEKSASTQNAAGIPQHQLPDSSILEKMLNYVKFMKDILTKKRRLGEFETVALTKECSSFLQNKLPPKMKDPGSFTIPCTIGNSYCGMALCDLGASINLMPMSIFKQLGIGEVRPTTFTLQLADRSLAHPDREIEDVLVRVDKFIFPDDYIVLDYEADREVPIILGRPFLVIGRTLIDVQKGELTMRVQDEKVTFNVFKAMRFPDEVEECSVVSVVDSLASREFETSNVGDPLEREFKAPKPSIEEPPELELKVLPSHLRYAYLGPSSTLPVIISAELSHDQEEKLLEILLENNGKGSIEGQRRLNPIMKEVVKKEIIKWLDASIIYPISDSSWVSLVQCVPKKGGITVVKNEDNELIPTRTMIGWRICMDYRKLNKATRKDHFPLPFIDQMLDRLAGREYYCFLDGYSGYNQIAVAPKD
ncbi:uncharacterized protein LOC133795851 [Humulus lupulus]|uniref:uncharacterized protein LOC133795851 n=1 Tax=Humulus lupulus TaxID=3486 RepID=UPI002B4026EC|nr:uncharacterized protein LOC133795851 [Humulus lupulus]